MYLRRYAVKPGERVVVATSNDSAYELAIALRHAGSEVRLVDSRADADLDPALSAEARGAGVAVSTGTTIEAVVGSRAVEAVTLSNGQRVPADLVAHSGGWTPSLHLYCHAKGKPQWDDAAGSYRPGAAVAGVDVVGAAAGLLGPRRDAASRGGDRGGSSDRRRAPRPRSGNGRRRLRCTPLASASGCGSICRTT